MPANFTPAPDRDAVIAAARQRGLAASHVARQDAEQGDGDAWWLFCDYDRFMAHLEEIEREKGIDHG